jgi:hypothetical protein
VTSPIYSNGAALFLEEIMQEHSPESLWSLETDTVMVMGYAGLRSEKDCPGEVQQQLLITNQSSRQREFPIIKKS